MNKFKINLKNNNIYVNINGEKIVTEGLFQYCDHYTMNKQNKLCTNGRLLFAARKKANMTQEDLHSITLIPKYTISLYERCKIAITDLHLNILANALNLNLNYFK